MRRPTILIVYDWFAPAYKAGGPIQSLSHLVTAINKHFDVRVLCSDREYDGTRLNVPRDQWIVYKDDVLVYYNSGGLPGVHSVLKSVSYDIIYLNGVFSPAYFLLPLFRASSRIIVAPRGMLLPAGLKQKQFKKRAYLFFVKWLLRARQVTWHASSQDEVDSIKSAIGRNESIRTVPHLTIDPGKAPPITKVVGELRLFTAALVGPMKNQLKVLQALLNVQQPVVYNLFGQIKDDDYWRECKDVIARMPAHVKVEYHGAFEPASLPGIIAQHHVNVQPSESENFSHSIAQTLLSGRPVITSHYTPWNELESNKSGMNIDISTAAPLLAAIEFFISMDADTYAPYCNNARRYALSKLDYDGAVRQLMEMLRSEGGKA